MGSGSSHEPKNPIHQGHLTKRALLNESNWRKRFFVLTPKEIVYYNKEGKWTIHSENSVISLTHDSKVEEGATRLPSQFHFEIHTTNRVLYVFAESAKERDKWMQQIRSVIGRLQNKSNVNHLRHRFESQTQENLRKTTIQADKGKVETIRKRLESSAAAKEAGRALDVKILPNDNQSLTEREIMRNVRESLASGCLILFRIEWIANEEIDRYHYDVENPRDQACTSILMENEYLEWRRQYTNENGAVESFMAKKKDDFLDCLRILQDKYNREPRIAVVRLQSKPEDAFAPPKFGNVIIVWNPVQDSQYLTLQDRALGVPLVLSALIKWLNDHHVLDGYTLLRDAGNISQGSENALDYSTLYRKLFKQGTVLGHESQDLISTKPEFTIKEIPSPENQASFIGSGRSRALTTSSSGKQPSTGLVASRVRRFTASATETSGSTKHSKQDLEHVKEENEPNVEEKPSETKTFQHTTHWDTAEISII